MPVRRPVSGDPGYDTFQWWNPFDWFGGHDETSMWKSDPENRAIMDADRDRALEREQDTESRRMLDLFRSELAQARQQESNRRGQYGKAVADYTKTVRDQSRADRRYWEGMRDRSLRGRKRGLDKYLSDLGQPRDIIDSALSDWLTARADARSGLQDVRSQQASLLKELKESPSTVAEQARMDADRALQQSVAMAGAFGGGLSTGFRNLQDRQATIAGDTLRKTSALRLAEHQQRLGQRAGVLGQMKGTSLDLANLGLSDINARTKLAGDISSLAGLERSARNEYYGGLSNMALQDFNIRTSLLGREQGILGSVAGMLGFGREGDMAMLGQRGGLSDRYAGLERGEYARMAAERGYQDAQLAQISQRRQGVLGAIGSIANAGLGTLGISLPFLTGGEGPVKIPGITQASSAPVFPSQPFEYGAYAASGGGSRGGF